MIKEQSNKGGTDMCGRYTTEMETDERQLLEILMRAEQNGGTSVQREMFPSEAAAVIAVGTDGRTDAFSFRWGFPTAQKGRLLINARAETAAEKPTFAPHLQLGRRCVIPTAGFFEWAHVGARKQADPAQKYRFNLPHTGILYLAGLYRPSQSAHGGYEFVILTRSANDSMAPIHDRMPVIVREEHIGEYLGDAASAERLLGETPPVLIKRLVS